MFRQMSKDGVLREGPVALACILTAVFLCAGMNGRDSNRSKSAVLGKSFQITVAANPTTGYKWMADYDKEFVSLKSKTYVRDPTKPKDWVGVGGQTVFVFVPVKTGRTRIRLVYRRTWEAGTSQEVTYSVTITAR